MRRPVDKPLEDIALAADVAQEIGIVVDHAYHRLDDRRVWNTLSQDIPRLREAIQRYREGGASGR